MAGQAPELLAQAVARAGGGSSDFDLNPQYEDHGTPLRPAAVLVAVMRQGDDWGVLLTKRSSALRHHPGQIAFPGGKVDPTDANATAAALREAQEEVALPPQNVRIIGALPVHRTITRFHLTPVAAEITRPFIPVAEPGEVDEVFFVPFAHVTDPARFRVQSRLWMGQRRHYYTVPYGPYYIWGATARILRALAEAVQP